VGASKWLHKFTPPPSKSLAKREKPVVIEQPEPATDPAEWVTCELHVSHIDEIYKLLSPQRKATGILTALAESD
jgi:hypothetical protein